MSAADNPVDALLLIDSATQSAAMLTALVTLVRRGRIGKLEIINVEQRPEWREQFGVQQVPWLTLGAFELHGLISDHQLERWIEHSVHNSGGLDYLLHLLETQRLNTALALVRDQPAVFVEVLEHIGVADQDATELRFAIHALIEELADSATLRTMLPQLEQLITHPSTAIRADAAHYLGLTGDHRAWKPLQALIQDPAPTVRAQAREAINMLDPQH